MYNANTLYERGTIIKVDDSCLFSQIQNAEDSPLDSMDDSMDNSHVADFVISHTPSDDSEHSNSLLAVNNLNIPTHSPADSFSLILLDDISPTVTPLHSNAPSEDFEKMMEFETFTEEELKASIKSLKFQSIPKQICYQVSHDISEDTMKRPGKLFPNKHDNEHENEHENGEFGLFGDALYRQKDEDTLHRQNCSRLSGLHRIPELNKSLNPKDLEHWIEQKEATDFASKHMMDQYKVRFNKMVSIGGDDDDHESDGKLVIDSNGLSDGVHKWTIEILSADVDLQEIGVIGTDKIEGIQISKDGAGVLDTVELKSRASYGCCLSDGELYYGSMNVNGSARCLRDLRPFFDIGWTVGDQITVKLNLKKWRIKFLLNGKAVRYAMSLDADKVYYPMICFHGGDCKYALRY